MAKNVQYTGMHNGHLGFVFSSELGEDGNYYTARGEKISTDKYQVYVLDYGELHVIEQRKIFKEFLNLSDHVGKADRYLSTMMYSQNTEIVPG